MCSQTPQESPCLWVSNTRSQEFMSRNFWIHLCSNMTKSNVSNTPNLYQFYRGQVMSCFILMQVCWYRDSLKNCRMPALQDCSWRLLIQTIKEKQILFLSNFITSLLSVSAASDFISVLLKTTNFEYSVSASIYTEECFQ